MHNQNRTERQKSSNVLANWEQRYLQTKQLWTWRPDAKLMQYFDLVKMGDVLDLGIGEGRNSLPFAMSGCSVDGVDISATAINSCKENFAAMNAPVSLTIGDLRQFPIKRDIGLAKYKGYEVYIHQN